MTICRQFYICMSILKVVITSTEVTQLWLKSAYNNNNNNYYDSNKFFWVLLLLWTVDSAPDVTSSPHINKINKIANLKLKRIPIRNRLLINKQRVVKGNNQHIGVVDSIHDSKNNRSSTIFLFFIFICCCSKHF